MERWFFYCFFLALMGCVWGGWSAVGLGFDDVGLKAVGDNGLK
jgi:hypothetical protein